jgi:hypothetical protein
VAILFAMAGGPLSALPAFVSNSVQIAMGYTDAMSLDGPAWQPIAGAVGVALVLLVGLWLTRQRDAAGLWPAVAAASVAAFLAFKWSMVRQDAYHAARLEIRIALAAFVSAVEREDMARAARDSGGADRIVGFESGADRRGAEWRDGGDCGVGSGLEFGVLAAWHGGGDCGVG